MIERSTVFVLGAGASEPYGFPLGSGLVDQAIQLLRHETEPRIAMLQEVCECPTSALRDFADALERAAIPSIDRFLEGRPDYLAMGKAVMAALLIPYENEHDLFTRDKTARLARRWYDYVLNRMATKPDDFNKNALAVLTFNYDRSFEHFLRVALEHRHQINSATAAQLVDAMPLVHLHGQLGGLGPLVDIRAGTRPYLPNVAPSVIRLAAAAINVVHENIATNPQFTRAKELLWAADEIWMLGFGYDGTNVKRLGLENFTDASNRKRLLKLIGTGYDLGAEEARTAARLVGQGLSPGLSLQDRKWDVLTLLREMWG